MWPCRRSGIRVQFESDVCPSSSVTGIHRHLDKCDHVNQSWWLSFSLTPIRSRVEGVCWIWKCEVLSLVKWSVTVRESSDARCTKQKWHSAQNGSGTVCKTAVTVHETAVAQCTKQKWHSAQNKSGTVHKTAVAQCTKQKWHSAQNSVTISWYSKSEAFLVTWCDKALKVSGSVGYLSWIFAPQAGLGAYSSWHLDIF